MHFSHIALGVTISLFTTDGFSINPIARHESPLFMSDQGWSNDNFLDALGNGSSAVDEANAKYEKEAQARAMMNERRLASMTGSGGDGMPDKVPPITQPNDEENPMGGQRFKQMMEMAKKSPVERNPQILAEPEPPMAAVPPQPVVPAAPVAPVGNVQAPTMDAHAIYQMQLASWQQQMTFYSQLIAADPLAASKMTMPPPPQPPSTGGVPTSPVAPTTPQQPVPPQPVPTEPQATANPADYAPKPVKAGNRDAYEISNPADVYFAQLKRDSTVRTQARKAGDIETANNTFADESVKALKNYLSPELIRTRREQLARNGGEFETSRDEMIIPYSEEEDVDRTYTGVSYRQKLQEKMEKRNQS